MEIWEKFHEDARKINAKWYHSAYLWLGIIGAGAAGIYFTGQHIGKKIEKVLQTPTIYETREPSEKTLEHHAKDF